MKLVEIPALYKQYFVDKSDERRMMFEKLSKLYNPQKGIYPASFVHITPSFYISDMTYVDSDKRISRFFRSEAIEGYVRAEKSYSGDPVIRGIQADYGSPLPIEEHSCDIMFSFYGGFVSQSCKKYLKNKGVLVCNNSHGDASLASVDSDYTLTGVINRKGNLFIISTQNLHEYFKKKDGSPIDRDKVLKSMTGEKFVKKGYAYIFQYTL